MLSKLVLMRLVPSVEYADLPPDVMFAQSCAYCGFASKKACMRSGDESIGKAAGFIPIRSLIVGREVRVQKLIVVFIAHVSPKKTSYRT